MTIPKKYFHDKLVLLMLSTSAFLTVLNIVLILLRVDSKHTSGYLLQYRPSQGLNAFTYGDFTTLALNLIGFSLLIAVLHFVLSIRTYDIRRQVSLTTLGLGILLSLLTLIVGNALLLQR